MGCFDCIQCLGTDNYQLKSAITAVTVYKITNDRNDMIRVFDSFLVQSLKPTLDSRFSQILKMELNMLVYQSYYFRSKWVHTSLLSHTSLPFSPCTPSLPHLSDKSIFADPHGAALLSRNPSWTLFCQHLNLYNLVYPT